MEIMFAETKYVVIKIKYAIVEMEYTEFRFLDFYSNHGPILSWLCELKWTKWIFFYFFVFHVSLNANTNWWNEEYKS